MEANLPLFLLSASALCFPSPFTEITGSPIPKAPWGQKTSLDSPPYPPSRTVPQAPIRHCPHGCHSTLGTSSGFAISHSPVGVGGWGLLQLQPPMLRGANEVEKLVRGPSASQKQKGDKSAKCPEACFSGDLF